MSTKTARKTKAQRQQTLRETLTIVANEPRVEGTKAQVDPIVLEADQPSEMLAALAEAEAEVQADHAADHEGPNAPRGKSVVPIGYKSAYAKRAVIEGRATKAGKRCNGDWLARELEAECIDGTGKFDMGRFAAILEANGVAEPFTRWPNRNNGWEGRLRMSGAIVLRGLVRRAGVLVTPEGAAITPEASFLG